jgi:hypothetical protein
VVPLVLNVQVDIAAQFLFRHDLAGGIQVFAIPVNVRAVSLQNGQACPTEGSAVKGKVW